MKPGHHYVAPFLELKFQDGPLKETSRNGTDTEAVLVCLIERLEHFQEINNGKYACEENERAIGYLKNALALMEQRTEERISRGVEGKSLS